MREKFSIKHWRQVRDITQPEMAEKLGVHVNTYRKMEKNPMKLKYITFQTICDILNVSADDIKMEEDTSDEEREE